MYALVLVILSQRSKSLLCVSAVRVNWETCQLTTERYVFDPLLTEKLTHS